MSKKKKPQPAIPDPPLLVLAKIKRERITRWLVSVKQDNGAIRFACPGGFTWYSPERLKVVDHPRNDAEAVEIITNANCTADKPR